VLLDTPPVLPVADTTILAPKVDGTLLIYQVGQIARGVLKRAKLQLDNVRANMYGIILNNVRAEMSPDYYHYQMRYYYGEDMPPHKRSILDRLMFWKRADIELRPTPPPRPERPKAADRPGPPPRRLPPERNWSRIIKIGLLILALAVLGVGLYIKLGPKPPAKKPPARQRKAAAVKTRVNKAKRPAKKKSARKEAGKSAAVTTKAAKKPAPGKKTRAPAVMVASREPPRATAAPAKEVPPGYEAAIQEGLYLVQLGVFSTEDSSKELARSVEEGFGRGVAINTFVNRQGREMFTVYLEKRVGYREGLRAAKELSSGGFESIIVHHQKISGSRIYP
jgi:hypothetical protein